MASINSNPAAAPSRMAIATARFNSITGDGADPANRSYSAAICDQSVTAVADASAWTAAMAA